MEYIALFLFGLVMGSFYNVLIYRLPRSISVIVPSSHCPSCRKPIKWYDNIPLLSFVILKGKCRNCKTKIPIQYPFVELVSGLIAVYSYLRWGATSDALVYYMFFSALLVLSFIDLKFFIIPDIITLPGIALGLLFSFFRKTIDPVQSITGLALGFGISFFIYLFYIKVRKIEGLGFGDVKLLAMIGSVTGVYGVLSALFLGSLLGLIFALPSVVKNRNIQFAIPFGPFLSLGCFLGILLEDYLFNSASFFSTR